MERLAIAGVNSVYPPSLPLADRMPPAVEPPLWGPQNAVGFGSYHSGGANLAG